MPAASNVDRFLRNNGVNFDTIWRASRTVASDQVIKTLLLVDGRRHALACIPQSRRIDLPTLNRLFARGFRLGGRDDALLLYPDLPPQCLLPAGIGTEVETFVDWSLLGAPEVAFETCDPRRLVRIDGNDFRDLFDRARFAHITCEY